MSNIIKQIEQEQLKSNLPSFRPGDTLEVKVWVVEGSKKRLQAFEGVVIAIRNRGLHSAFTLRKISNGVGVERVFQTHSPVIDSIVKVMCVKRNFTIYVSVQVNLHVSENVWAINSLLLPIRQKKTQKERLGIPSLFYFAPLLMHYLLLYYLLCHHLKNLPIFRPHFG